jgi:large subunit ribosomal protein L30
MAGKTLKIQYVRSAVGRPRPQREAVKGLGLRRLNQIVEREDTAAVRGMIDKVSHLVQVIEGDKS